jgi:hypothetical protein
VLRNEGADLAADDMIRQSQSEAESIARLAAEYRTIAQAAQGERWDTLLKGCGLTPDQVAQVEASEAHGPLLAAFRDAEAQGLDIEVALPLLVTGRTLVGVDDVASVLHRRVDCWTEASRRPSGGAGFIVGLIPRAQKVTDPDMQQGPDRTRTSHGIQSMDLHRAGHRGTTSVVERPRAPPSDPSRRLAWLREACTVAAYRDLWKVDGPTVAIRHAEVGRAEQFGHQRRAQAATDRSVAITRIPDPAQTWGDASAHIESGVHL